MDDFLKSETDCIAENLMAAIRKTTQLMKVLFTQAS